MPVASLRTAAWVQGGEGVALLGLTGYFIVETAAGHAETVRTAIALAITTAALAGGALYVCVNLYRQRRWARSVAVMTQLFMFPIALTLLNSGWGSAGAVLAVAAAVALFMLFHPATTLSLQPHTQQRDDSTPQ